MMNKKSLEIISSVGSVILLIIMFALSHQMRNVITQEYGFIFSLVVFILGMSVIGMKLNEIQ
jgi:hypothetical protein